MGSTWPSGPTLREEEIRVAAGAQVETVHLGAPRVAERPLGRRPEAELAVRRQVRPEAPCERAFDFRADLVAARADRRTDGRRQFPLAERRATGCDDPLEQPAPAGVQDRERGPLAVRPGDGDREAVGR